MHRLYEASMKGCVSGLNTLMDNDQLILHKISLASFTQTPLFISCLLGHLHFTKALRTRKSELAMELDSLKHSPLHLACIEGHVEIVIELLKINKDVCLVEDQDRRIPLHLAAMRGREKVIKELVSAKPESIFVMLHGDTGLHSCVRFNQLKALKLLLPLVGDDHDEFLNSKTHVGNTILKLSEMLK